MSSLADAFAKLPKEIDFEPQTVVVDADRAKAYQAVVQLDLGSVRREAIPPSFLYTIYLSQEGFRDRYLAYGVDAQTAIHASHRFDYHRPILPGEELSVHSRVKKIIAKESASNFIVFEETQATAAGGEKVFTSTATFAFRAHEDAVDLSAIEKKEYEDEADFPEIIVPAVNADRLRRFAEASLDWNPIHLDADAAKASGFATPIVHGMLISAFLAEASYSWIDHAVFERLSIRFAATTAVGDELVLVGREIRRKSSAEPKCSGDRNAERVVLEVAALGRDRSIRAIADVHLLAT